MNSISSSIQGAASLTSPTSLDDSLSDMYHSPPRPLPYDVDPRSFRMQRGVLVSRREKGSSHSHEESEPLRRDTDVDSESLITRDKWNESDDGSKEQRPRSSLKHSMAETTTGYGFIYSSSEDEDVCPTCLEGKSSYCFSYLCCSNKTDLCYHLNMQTWLTHAVTFIEKELLPILVDS